VFPPSKESYQIRQRQISGIHGGENVDYGFLGCDAMWSCRWLPAFRRKNIASFFRIDFCCEAGGIRLHGLTNQKTIIDKKGFGKLEVLQLCRVPWSCQRLQEAVMW
jgi:hypothetical protein